MWFPVDWEHHHGLCSWTWAADAVGLRGKIPKRQVLGSRNPADSVMLVHSSMLVPRQLARSLVIGPTDFHFTQQTIWLFGPFGGW